MFCWPIRTGIFFPKASDRDLDRIRTTSRRRSPSKKAREVSEIIWGADNTFKTYLIEKGDVDSVWEKADYIVEGEYSHRRAGAALHRK